MSNTVVVDIGGTYTRAAIMTAQGHIDHQEKYLNYAYDNVITILTQYINSHQLVIDSQTRCCIAMAGPVANGMGTLTNIAWTLDVDTLKKQLPFSQIALVNDFHALGYCIPRLTDNDTITLQEVTYPNHPCKTLVGAGTGLGVAHVHLNNNTVHVHPSEGGHVDFAPINRQQIRLLEFLFKKYQHVSYEHILSGHGLEHLFEFLCLENKTTFNNDYHASPDISGKRIIQLAMEEKNPIAVETISLFCDIYAAFLGNVALQDLPYGGIYITGGIAKHITPMITHPHFLKSYHTKGRLSSILKKIPIYYITHPHAGLLGAGNYMQQIAEPQQPKILHYQ